MFNIIEKQVNLQPDSKVTILYHNDVYGKDFGEQTEKRFKELQNNSQKIKEIVLKPIDMNNIFNHKPDIKEAEVVIIIPNGSSRTTIIPLVQMAQEEIMKGHVAMVSCV